MVAQLRAPGHPTLFTINKYTQELVHFKIDIQWSRLWEINLFVPEIEQGVVKFNLGNMLQGRGYMGRKSIENHNPFPWPCLEWFHFVYLLLITGNKV